MRVLVSAVVAVLVLPVAGCTTTTTTVCVDSIGPLSTAEAGEQAAIVVVGTVTGSAGERSIYQESSPVHGFSVEAVVKGELDATEIEVAAVPITCNGPAGPFPDGDPLDTDDRVELFLVDDDGQYRLLTPWDGVVAAPEGEPLPWEG